MIRILAHYKRTLTTLVFFDITIWGKEWTKRNLWKTTFSRPYHFKVFKGCLPQILLGPLLNTLSHTKR